MGPSLYTVGEMGNLEFEGDLGAKEGYWAGGAKATIPGPMETAKDIRERRIKRKRTDASGDQERERERETERERERRR